MAPYLYLEMLWNLLIDCTPEEGWRMDQAKCCGYKKSRTRHGLNSSNNCWNYNGSSENNWYYLYKSEEFCTMYQWLKHYGKNKMTQRMSSIAQAILELIMLLRIIDTIFVHQKNLVEWINSQNIMVWIKVTQRMSSIV